VVQLVGDQGYNLPFHSQRGNDVTHSLISLIIMIKFSFTCLTQSANAILAIESLTIG